MTRWQNTHTDTLQRVDWQQVSNSGRRTHTWIWNLLVDHQQYQTTHRDRQTPALGTECYHNVCVYRADRWQPVMSAVASRRVGLGLTTAGTDDSLVFKEESLADQWDVTLTAGETVGVPVTVLERHKLGAAESYRQVHIKHRHTGAFNTALDGFNCAYAQLAGMNVKETCVLATGRNVTSWLIALYK